MRKPKVCLVISNLNIGGAEISMLKTIQILQNEVDFYVISLTDFGLLGGKLKEMGVKVYKLNIINIVTFVNSLFVFYKLVKKIKPDVVHTWMYHSDLLGGIIAKLANVKQIFWSIRNTDLISGTSLFTRIIGRLNSILSFVIPDKIIAVSYSAKMSHIKINYCERKMIVIPNGYYVPIKNFSDLDIFFLRNKFNISDKSIIIGSVGRYNEYKDHESFLKSLLLLLEKCNDLFDLHFFLVGKNVNNPKLISIIDNSKYKDKFHFIDETNDINMYYYLFDIFCLHSISEGFPNVLAEAMYHAKICISTDVGDARIILQDDSLIVPIKSPEILALKIYKVLNFDDSKKRIIQEKNFSIIDNNYNIRNIKNKYLELYKSKLIT